MTANFAMPTPNLDAVIVGANGHTFAFRASGMFVCVACSCTAFDIDDDSAHANRCSNPSRLPVGRTLGYAAPEVPADAEGQDEDELGSCGCTDYHYADCPTRTGDSGGIDAATFFALDAEAFERFMDGDDGY